MKKNWLKDSMNLSNRFKKYDYFYKNPKRIQVLNKNCVFNIPPWLESRHSLVVGVSGAGKTQFISQIIDNLRRRGDKAIILDLKGGNTAAFYDPSRDYIFNPLDRRNFKWTISNDLNIDMKIAESEVIANSLINDLAAQTENEKFFLTGAKNVAKGLVLFALASGHFSNKALCESLFTDDFNVIRQRLKAVNAIDALSALGSKPSPQSDGIKGTMHSWSRAIELLKDSDGDFSIKKWIEKPGQSFIFLNANKKYEKIVNPAARFFIDFFLNILMELGDDLDRRIFILLDEFQNINAIPTIIDILTLGRSAGASLILGTQDFGMIDKRYGQDAKTTMINNANSLYIFKISEPKTAEYLSQTLGEAEIEEYQTSSSLSLDESWDRVNIQTVKKIEKIVMPQELQTLDDLNYYIKINNNFSKSKLQLIKREKITAAFVPISQNVVLRADEDEITDTTETEIAETVESENTGDPEIENNFLKGV